MDKLILPLDMNWSLMTTELALILFTVGMMIFDLFLPNDEKRGRTLANTALAGVGLLILYQLSQWGNFGITLNGSFHQDGVSLFFKIIFMLSAFFTLFMGREYQAKLKRGHGEFTLLVLFSLIGMLFLASAQDFLLFFVSLEILSVSLYIMTSYLKDQSRSIEAGIKYILLGALSTAIFLYGLSFVYGTTGSTSYTEIYSSLLLMPSVPTAFIFGMILVLSALFFKIAAVPFHLWVPDIYQGAPSPVTSFLATGSKAAGFIALIRLTLTAFEPLSLQLGLIFSVLAAITIVYGNLAAIPQNNIKRMLGYSSIGHAGYLLIGLAAFQFQGLEAVSFYLLSYLFSTAGAFLVIVYVSKTLDTNEIDGFSGLGQRSPVLAAGMLIALLSLAGVPPLSGFFAKFYVLWTGVKAGYLWLVIIGVANVVTSLYYYLKVIKAMYLGKADNLAPLQVTTSQKTMQYFSIAAIILLGIYPGPIVQLLQASFASLQ